jgi:hypothetical protein
MVKAKKTVGQEHLDLSEVMRSSNKNNKFPVNKARFNFKITKENCLTKTAYSKIAERLINEYKRKTLLNAKEFQFNADVFRILRHQLYLKI